MNRDVAILIACGIITFAIYSFIDGHQSSAALTSYYKLVEKAHKPRVIHFSMEGCGACETLEPSWKQVVAKYSGQVDFETIMWEGNDPHQLIPSFGIHGFPTMVYIDETGKYMGRDRGAISQEQLNNEVDALLNKRKLACNDR